MFILHFLFSLVLLGFVVGSLFLYFYSLYWLVSKIFRRKNIVSLKSPKGKKIFFIFLLINFIIYAGQIKEWLSPRSAYPNAKVYYAVGNVVHFYRISFASFIAPDNPLIYPLVYPLKLVYVIGKTQLPDGDGEWAMWQYKWFLYPYIKKMTFALCPLSNIRNVWILLIKMI